MWGLKRCNMLIIGHFKGCMGKTMFLVFVCLDLALWIKGFTV